MIIVPPITLGDNSTFTRASTKNYYDINGQLSVTPAAVDTMVLEYDPRLSETNINQSVVSPYYLIEDTATNLLIYPKDFSNVVWNKNNSYIIPNCEGNNAFARQFGDKLVEDISNGGHYVYYGFNSNSNETTTFSVYAKAGERTRIALRRSNSTTESCAAYFDLSTGTVVAVDPNGTDYTSPKASIKRVRDNWYRCSFTVTKGNVNSVNWAQIDLIQSGTSAAYTGDGVSGVYIAYAQVETGTSMTSPVPDNTAFVSRATTATYFDSSLTLQTAAINVARSNDYAPGIGGGIVNKGLTLEAAATNTLLRSEQMGDAVWQKYSSSVLDDAALAVNGVMVADKFYEDSTNNSHGMFQSFTLSSNTDYVFSFFVKAAGRTKVYAEIKTLVPSFPGAVFDLTAITSSPINSARSGIIKYTNGWFRCWITGNSGTGSAPNNVNIVLMNDTAVVGNIGYQGDGASGIYLWGTQLESGVYPSSYIPTTSSTVTRAADISTSTSATRAADVISTTNAIVQTNVPETDYTLWNGATAYTIGQYVRYVASNVHKVYVALTNNTNKNPTTNPTDWQDAGSTNAWKMFDQSVQSQTTVAGGFNISVFLNGNPISNMTLMNVYGKKVRATLVHKTDGVIYDQTINLIGYQGVTDWYTYFYNKYYKDTSFMFTDIPTYGDATLNLYIYSNGVENGSVGVCVLGNSVDIAAKERVGNSLQTWGVEHGAKLGIQDYSVKDVDDFGNYTILERAYAKRSDYTVYMEPEDMNGVFNLLASRRATPTVYIGSDLDKHRCTIDYGFYKDFSIEISYPEYSICTIQIEGLT